LQINCVFYMLCKYSFTFYVCIKLEDLFQQNPILQHVVNLTILLNQQKTQNLL
jgi:hypothetical protein